MTTATQPAALTTRTAQHAADPILSASHTLTVIAWHDPTIEQATGAMPTDSDDALVWYTPSVGTIGMAMAHRFARHATTGPSCWTVDDIARRKVKDVELVYAPRKCPDYVLSKQHKAHGGLNIGRYDHVSYDHVKRYLDATPEVAARLASLGYVSAPARATASTDSHNPRDHIHEFNEITAKQAISHAFGCAPSPSPATAAIPAASVGQERRPPAQRTAAPAVVR